LGTEILAIARKNSYTDDVKALLNGLAYAYIFKAKYDKALTYLFESLELKRHDGDKFEISVALHNIGLVYYKLGDVDKALSYYKQSYRLKTQIENKYDYDILMVNIALCYVKKNLHSEGMRYIQEGFSQCKGSCSDKFLLQAHFCLGVIAVDFKNFSSAEKHFLKSYGLSKKMEDERFQLDNNIYLSQIYIESKQIFKAEQCLRIAEGLIGQDSPYRYESIRVYSEYIDLYKKSKNWTKLSIYQDKYIALNDSIFGAKLTANMMKIEAEYVEKEYKARISSQNKILALNEEVIYKQRVGNLAITAVTVLVIALAIVLAKNNNRNKKLNWLLDQKVKERTRELEISKDRLQRAWHEREIMISRASSDIQSSIATIRGLAYLGSRELHPSVAWQYKNELEMTSNRLYDVLVKIQLSSVMQSR
jgi:tetratricopeptide (TPR) repeat protein